MSSDFCIKCDNALAVYCGKCVDAERAELERLRRLVPTGSYTLNVAHEKEIQRLRSEIDQWLLAEKRMREAFRAAERRELKALAELDEERANVETLKTHVETLREAWRSASDEVKRLRAEASTLTTDEVKE